MALVHVLAAAVLSLAGAGAQAPAPGASQTVFRAETELVTLSVAVTDPQDRQVTGLGSDDFVVLENGKPQIVRFFASAEVPLDVVLLIDTSSSMADKLEPSRQAARRFLASLRPSDRAALVEFNTRVRVLQPFTSDASLVGQALSDTRAGGSTALYTGLYVALDHFTRLQRDSGQIRKSAIVVLSDGEDTASLIGEEEVTERARRAGVPLYFVSLLSGQQEQQVADQGGRRRSAPRDFVLKALAGETGARAYFPSRLEELDGVYAAVAHELSLQVHPRVRPGGLRRRRPIPPGSRAGARTPGGAASHPGRLLRPAGHGAP